MCYSLREPDPERKGASQEPVPPSRQTLSRPRVAVAIAFGIATVATAALLLPSQTPAVSGVKPAQPAAAVAGPATADASLRPSPAAIEQTTLGVDDGVPSGAEVARTERTGSSGRCAHDPHDL